MKIKFLFYFLALFAIAFFACNGDSDDDASSDSDTTLAEVTTDEYSDPTQPIVMENEDITLTEIMGTPQFAHSMLQITSPTEGKILAPGMTQFTFDVNNFELGEKTSDADKYIFSNSPGGQHIHLIVDNGPYAALYEPEHNVLLEEGVHTVLAFLSRSYHMSIKHANAHKIMQMQVGGNVRYDTSHIVDTERNLAERQISAIVGRDTTLLPDLNRAHIFYRKVRRKGLPI